MTSTPRRPGFRLPWSTETADDGTDAAAPEQTDSATATTDSVAPAEAAAPTSTEVDTAATAMPVEAAAPPAPEAATKPGATPTPEPFLQDLVDAMRRVAEETRDRNLGELRTLVDQRVEQVGERATDRVEELRRTSELDIKGIGDWERDELERVRGEAGKKVESRKRQLEQQLEEHQRSTEREKALVQERLTAYEAELQSFFENLATIKDPALFVTTAKQMPAVPSLEVGAQTAPAVNTTSASAPPATSAPATAEPATTETNAAAPATGETLTQRLAQLGIDKSQPSVNGAAATADAATETETAAEPQPDEEPQPPSLEERLAELDQQMQAKTAETATPAPTTNGEASTAIVVKGLGSFGAITSFKQSLEKAEGIRSVTLSLGPTGEFVYRAVHDPAFDIEGTIGKVEAGSEMERQADGTLRVTVVRTH